MAEGSKYPWRILAGLTAAALIVFCGMFWTAWMFYRRGSFVNDKLYAAEIARVSRRHGVDPQLVRAVIFQESRFAYDAIGRQGEVGLMQVMPGGSVADWARIHKKPQPTHAALMQVELNLEIGVWYLSRALKRWEKYKDGVRLALAQYNAGASRAERWKPAALDAPVGPEIKIASTRAYVEKIMERYRKYSGEK